MSEEPVAVWEGPGLVLRGANEAYWVRQPITVLDRPVGEMFVGPGYDAVISAMREVYRTGQPMTVVGIDDLRIRVIAFEVDGTRWVSTRTIGVRQPALPVPEPLRAARDQRVGRAG